MIVIFPKLPLYPSVSFVIVTVVVAGTGAPFFPVNVNSNESPVVHSRPTKFFSTSISISPSELYVFVNDTPNVCPSSLGTKCPFPSSINVTVTVLYSTFSYATPSTVVP